MAAETPDTKSVVGDAFLKMFEESANNEWETLLGLSTLEKAMNESVSSVALNAEVTAEESGDSIAFGFTTAVDPANQALKFGIDIAADEIEIGAELYADSEKMQAQVPTVAEDVLVLKYKEGVTEPFPEGSLFEGLEAEMDLICELLGMAGDTLTVDIEGILTRFQENSVAYLAMVDGIAVNELEPIALYINDAESECDAYEVVFNGQLVHDYVTELVTFVRDDEEIWNAMEPWFEFVMTYSAEMDSEEMPPSEVVWKTTVDDFMEEWAEMREYMPTEIPVEVALYDGQIAAIQGFWGEESSLYFDLTFTGGDYLAQNMNMYCEVTEDDDISSFYMDKYTEVDEEGAYVSYLYMIDEDETSETMRMDMNYDVESGEFSVYSSVGDDEYAEEVTMEGCVTALEKGKSIAVELYNVDGQVNEEIGTGTIGLEIQTGLEPITALEGPELNILTATQEDFMNYIMNFMQLVQQIEEMNQPEVMETEMTVAE